MEGWDRQVSVALGELAAQLEMGFGKGVQKLLALAFLEAGAERVTERSVQGIDLEVEWGGRLLAIEVKTCKSGSVSLAKKDVEGMEARRREGADAYLAVLGLRPTDRWIFAQFDALEIPPQKAVPLDGFRAWRNRDLEQAVEPAFRKALARYAPEVLRFGPAVLDGALRDHARFNIA